MIKAQIVADSLNPQGDRLISVLATFPRIILAEVNTHRMLSKNTSSSRAIPFNKMVEAVQNNLFIPIAWQKHHSGMQGTEYLIDTMDIQRAVHRWLIARDKAIEQAKVLNEGVGVTKQLCNRLLEPFMWTTMLITGSKEGWDNFFELRCPSYRVGGKGDIASSTSVYKSKKDAIKEYPNTIDEPDINWMYWNEGQAEIHIMDLAEKIYDAMNESTPKQLKAGEWHIPFEDKIPFDLASWQEDRIKISTAMAARTSYTVVGDEKEVDYEKMIKLHDRLIEMRHDSPLEHCARAMSDEEYFSWVRGESVGKKGLPNRFTNRHYGWCKNYKGFIQYRHIIETNN